MPKLRAMFSSVFEPFCWPTTTTARPSSSAMPPTMAGSSRNNRSPCSSWNLSKTPAMTSSACGRFGSRASWTACHAVPRVAAISAASVMSAGSARWPFVSTGGFLPRMRSTIDIYRLHFMSCAAGRNASRKNVSRSRSSGRGTIWSMKPCASTNSEHWNPFGSFSPMVWSVTRAPEKPMSASGSARMRSPSDAYDARTPPVVGSVRMLTNGTPASARRPRAPTILAICMSARVPSCMRAPPDAETMTSGRRSARARSAIRVIFSPTTLPIEPPMNAKSIAAIAAGMSPMRANPVMTASRSPVFVRAAVMRAGYGLESENARGSPEVISTSCSSNEPLSMRSSMRSRARIRKWWSHLVQTFRFRTSCLLNSISLQLGHCVQRCDGKSFRPRAKGIRRRITETLRAQQALRIPADAEDPGTAVRRDGRPRFARVQLDTVVPGRQPVRDRLRPVRRVRVDDRRVQLLARWDLRLDELLQPSDRLLARADLVDRLELAVLDLDDRLHLEERTEHRLHAGGAARALQLLESVDDRAQLHVAGQLARERDGLLEACALGARAHARGRDERPRARGPAAVDH